MGRKNLNLESVNQLGYKALGRSFTNIVAKNSFICCFGSLFVKNFKPYVIYSTELLNLVINLTQYELNRADTYINTKSKVVSMKAIQVRHKI